MTAPHASLTSVPETVHPAPELDPTSLYPDRTVTAPRAVMLRLSPLSGSTGRRKRGRLRAPAGGPETRRYPSGTVDEHITAAVVRCDESETLLTVDPLHCSLRHARYCLPLSEAVREPGSQRPRSGGCTDANGAIMCGFSWKRSRTGPAPNSPRPHPDGGYSGKTGMPPGHPADTPRSPAGQNVTCHTPPNRVARIPPSPPALTIRTGFLASRSGKVPAPMKGRTDDLR